MRRPGLRVASIVLLCILSAHGRGKSFVRVEGTHFTRGGKPYRYTGVNMWYACNLGSTMEGRRRLVRELDHLKALGALNLRILAASEKSRLAGSIRDAIQTAPGVYDEKLLEGLDFALSQIGKRGMTAVLFLNNYWQWSGGMAQYVSWATGDTIPDPDTSGDWGGFMRFSARFYSIPKAVAWYRQYVGALVLRTNRFTNRRYADDPAIMAWELSNEPRPGTDGLNGRSNIEAFVRWNRETAAFIHSLDPNHLVTTGSEGMVGCLQDTSLFIKTHADPAIDYINCHLWPRNWGWFRAKRMEETLKPSGEKSVEYLRLHMKMARRLGRPLTIEEFGLDRDLGAFEAGTPTTARDYFLSLVFALVEDSLAAGSPVAGTNVWTWGGLGRPGALPVGEPPSEPQGLNSIYDSDVSTLEILSRHAARLRKMDRTKGLR